MRMSDSGKETEASQNEGSVPLDTADKFSALLDQMQLMNASLTKLVGDQEELLLDSDNAADGAESGSEDNELSERQQSKGAAANNPPESGRKTLLKAIAQDLHLKEKTGPAIEVELAELINDLLKDKMSPEALKTKLDKYARPENVEALRTPKVNPLIWNQISAAMRTQDAGSQKNQNTLVASLIAMAKAADIVMRNHEEEIELLASLTDAIALAIQCHHEASHTRRLAMKKELHKDYGSVCSLTTVVGTSEFLFGDLSKLTKDITDANKLTKKVRPSHSSGRGDRHDTRRPNYGSFTGQGNRRFHPYQGSKGSNFLGRGRFSKYKKKKEGDATNQRH